MKRSLKNQGSTADLDQSGIRMNLVRTRFWVNEIFQIIFTVAVTWLLIVVVVKHNARPSAWEILPPTVLFFSGIVASFFLFQKKTENNKRKMPSLSSLELAYVESLQLFALPVRGALLSVAVLGCAFIFNSAELLVSFLFVPGLFVAFFLIERWQRLAIWCRRAEKQDDLKDIAQVKYELHLFFSLPEECVFELKAVLALVTLLIGLLVVGELDRGLSFMTMIVNWEVYLGTFAAMIGSGCIIAIVDAFFRKLNPKTAA